MFEPHCEVCGYEHAYGTPHIDEDGHRGGFGPTPYLDRELSTGDAQPAIARKVAEDYPDGF
jgi:hypothetical protein